MNTLKYTKVTLLRSRISGDQLVFTIELPAPFPKLNEQFPESEYTPAKIYLQKGYTEEWCEKCGIKIDETINM